jgi:hypothetical protein
MRQLIAALFSTINPEGIQTAQCEEDRRCTARTNDDPKGDRMLFTLDSPVSSSSQKDIPDTNKGKHGSVKQVLGIASEPSRENWLQQEASEDKRRRGDKKPADCRL